MGTDFHGDQSESGESREELHVERSQETVLRMKGAPVQHRVIYTRLVSLTTLDIASVGTEVLAVPANNKHCVAKVRTKAPMPRRNRVVGTVWQVEGQVM